MTPDVIEIDTTWLYEPSDEERRQFHAQARSLGERFETRDRQNVSGVFFNLALSAIVITPLPLQGGARARASGSVVPTEWTTPADQFRDDLGTIVAFLLPLLEDPGVLPGRRCRRCPCV
jgi:hypothetical protein